MSSFTFLLKQKAWSDHSLAATQAEILIRFAHQ